MIHTAKTEQRGALCIALWKCNQWATDTVYRLVTRERKEEQRLRLEDWCQTGEFSSFQVEMTIISWYCLFFVFFLNRMFITCQSERWSGQAVSDRVCFRMDRSLDKTGQDVTSLGDCSALLHWKDNPSWQRVPPGPGRPHFFRSNPGSGIHCWGSNLCGRLVCWNRSKRSALVTKATSSLG